MTSLAESSIDSDHISESFASEAGMWRTLGSEVIDSAFGTVDMTWGAQLKVRWNTTPTEAEFRELWPELQVPLMRGRCVNLILSLPDVLVPLIVPELESLIDYESRMLVIREARQLLPKEGSAAAVRLPIKR